MSVSAKKCGKQVSIGTLQSCCSKKVYQILLEKEAFEPDIVSQYLLRFVKRICQKCEFSGSALDSFISSREDYSIIYTLLDAGADIDIADEDKNTCLLYAVIGENCNLCDVLLQCGADMWANTEYGISVYDYVSTQSHSKDLIVTFQKYYPGLWKAVECENIYQVRQLINCWCRTNLQKNGTTLKALTLQTGNEEIINLIYGVYESMDLVYHVFAKNTEAVKKKLETCKKKIRLNLRKMSDHGAPILYYLIQSKDVSTIELFIKHGCQIYTMMRDSSGNDMPVLFSALSSDMTFDVLKALLPENGTQVEEMLYKILYKGMTVLEVAMENKVSLEIFKLLIERGGPLLLCDRNQFNESILDVAIYQNNQSYIDVIDQSVHDWVINPSQYTGRRRKLALLGWIFEPVHYMEDGKINNWFLAERRLLQAKIKGMALAIKNGDVQKFSALKCSVYDTKLCEANMLWYARVFGDGMPLLHTAVLFNRPEIVQIILDDKPLKESVDNLFDQHHRTALHYAFACSSAKRIQMLLLNSGCSEHILDKRNKEPLDFKDKQDNPDIIELINRLKDKRYYDDEPDPWSNHSVDAPENIFYPNEDYNEEPQSMPFNLSCENRFDISEDTNSESDEYSSEEITFEDEKYNLIGCQIF